MNCSLNKFIKNYIEKENEMNELDKKMEAANIVIPEIYFGEYDGKSIKSVVTDIEIIETDDFIVVASKHETHSWMRGCGVEWKEYSRVCCVKKTNKTEQYYWIQATITTRHSYDPREDLKNLWGFSSIEIKDLGNNVISVAWNNGKKSVQNHRIDLSELQK